MTKKKQPLLKVIEHNWGLIGPGDWRTVTWLVYHDGSYEVVSSFNPIINDSEELMGMINRRERPKLVKKQSTGIMEEDAFTILREALMAEPWRDPTLDVHACDGVAWEIESYRADGSIEKSSGKLDYIYGHRVLETIVSLLPGDGDYYDSSAFISVRKKD